MWVWFLCFAATAAIVAEGAGAGAARLVCYVENAVATNNFSECTHLIYIGDVRGEKLDVLLKEYRKNNPRLKIIVRVSEGDKDVPSLLDSKYIQGLELHDVHRSLNKTKVLETVQGTRSTMHSVGGGPLFLSLPSHPELLAKYYDLVALVKIVDLMTVQTHALGLVKNTTYHPSRLSGLWDMMNTDSVVDLVIGLGVPASKIVVSLPAAGYKFSLLNETFSTPGSPTSEDGPKEIDQSEICSYLQKGRWTLERDQDLSGPYAFQNKSWISFEDSLSIDVKGKYARVRGLAGLALYNVEKDIETPCGPTLRKSLSKVLNQQSRAPRAAVLRSLENEILSAQNNGRVLDALQVSPYRITQVVDSDGVIHSIREDTRTEFSCTRQGYFVHPRSCARFYRCVKFDQLSADFTVFEFDCPDGLAFDSRYEVCVWPGSLPDSQACPGSSEIAPVPQSRFICPDQEGFYVDPENCRWFFACLDHGKAPLSAYEFRCPFGLGFDPQKLKCEWPWLVPDCKGIAKYEAVAYGFNGGVLTGANGFQGKTPETVNIAAHNSLASGASLDNLVGIQGGYLSKVDDDVYITNQDVFKRGYIDDDENESVTEGLRVINKNNIGPGSFSYNVNSKGGSFLNSNFGLYNGYEGDSTAKYVTGSLILDEFRKPFNTTSSKYSFVQNLLSSKGLARFDQDAFNKNTAEYIKGLSQGKNPLPPGSLAEKLLNYQSLSQYEADQTGAYIHDTTGDTAEPYFHVDLAALPYLHQDVPYKHAGDNLGTENYATFYEGDGKYTGDNSGLYVQDDSDFYSSTKSGSTKYGKGSYTGSNENLSKFTTSAINNGGYSGKLSSFETGSTISGSSTTSPLDKVQNYDSTLGYQYTKPAITLDLKTGGLDSVTPPTYSRQSFHKVQFGKGYKTFNIGYDYTKSEDYDSYYTGNQGFVSNSQGSTDKPLIIGNKLNGLKTQQYKGSYVNVNQGDYLSNLKSYTAGGHVLTAGAVNGGLVGKTTLIDNQFDSGIESATRGFNTASQLYSTIQHLQPGYVSVVPQSVVSISHAGTDNKNYNRNSYVTTPTASLIPTTVTPFTVTTPVPTIPILKGTLLPEAPRTSVKQIFGISQPAITVVQPTAVNQYIPSNVQITDYNQGVNQQYENGYSSGNYNSVGSTQSTVSHSTGYDYPKPSIKFEDGVSFTTPAPTVVVSKFQPQGFSHNEQNLNNVETASFNLASSSPVTEEPFRKVYAYTTGSTISSYSLPTVSTIAPESYSQQTIHRGESEKYFSASIKSDEGYNYDKPTNSNLQLSNVYNTGEPNLKLKTSSIATLKPILSSVDNLKSTNYKYIQPEVTYNQPISSVQYTTVQPEYNTAFQNVGNSKFLSSLANEGYSEITRSSYTEPKTTIEYTTPAPIYAQSVENTYQPQVFSQQTLHEVDSTKINTYSQETSNIGYDYTKFASQSQNGQVQYSTPITPAVSTYNPKTYSKQIIYNTQKLSSIPYSTLPADLTQKQPEVTIYENPLAKYTENAAPLSYVNPTTTVYTQTFQPHVQQQVSQVIPTSQRTLNTQNTGFTTYGQPEIQRDTENLSTGKAYSDATAVSYQTIHHSSSKNNRYELENETFEPTIVTTPRTQLDYSANVHYSGQEYLPSKPDSSYATKILTTSNDQSSIYYQSKDENDYKNGELLQQYSTIQQNVPVSKVSFGTSPPETNIKETVHLSTFPGTKVITKYKQVASQSPEIQSTYTAEEYLPPIVSSISNGAEITSTTIKPQEIYFIPTTTREYLPPTTPPSNTFSEIVSIPSKSTIYLPPPTSDPLIKSNNENYQGPEYLPPLENTKPHTVNFESFGFENADEKIVSSIKYNPYSNNRKQVTDSLSTTTETILKSEEISSYSKTNLLGFGTVGPDAGLVKPIRYTTTSTPKAISPDSYTPRRRPTSTFTPIKQEIVEFTSPTVPIRRTRPKVAVVTKINDFNPLLVKKLGAVCSCQSPTLILKGTRPTLSETDVDVQKDLYDYVNTEDEGAADNSNGYKQFYTTSSRPRIVTPKPSSSTFNPIIVPDDTYYEDYPEASNVDEAIAGKSDIIESQISSTPSPVYSTSPKPRSRVKSVSNAPNYRQILNNQANPSTEPSNLLVSVPDTKSFDRYGPGGLRGQDETLQGSVDCQRAGLFRHPKHCNKFYACRWDCTKQRYTLHVFNCPIQLTFDNSLGACNWPSQGPSCQGDTLLTNTL